MALALLPPLYLEAPRMMIFINSERVSVLAGVETDWDSLTEVTVLHEAAGSRTAAHETSATPARSNRTLSIWERLGCTTALSGSQTTEIDLKSSIATLLTHLTCFLTPQTPVRHHAPVHPPRVVEVSEVGVGLHV